jgi:RNA polymerase sigma factor (sigma-70 family)
MAATVFAYLLREVKDEQTALDLTAETFATAWAKRDDFRGASDGEAKSWVWSIAYSCIGQFHRTKRVDAAACERVGWERPIATEDDLLELEMLEIVVATQQHLAAALGGLPSDQQQVLRMRFCEEPLPFEEIAARLGVTSITARKRASRGLVALRQDPHSHEIRALRQT